LEEILTPKEQIENLLGIDWIFRQVPGRRLITITNPDGKQVTVSRSLFENTDITCNGPECQYPCIHIRKVQEWLFQGVSR